MKKYYIKMNDKNYLSIGNVIEIIKEIASNKSATQSEIFLCIFNVNNINNTAINNYCIGYRPIPIELKKKYHDLKEEHFKDKYVYTDIIISIISILDNKIYSNIENKIEFINNSVKLKNVITNLLKICSVDKNIKKEYISILKKLNNYDALIELLNYIDTMKYICEDLTIFGKIVIGTIVSIFLLPGIIIVPVMHFLGDVLKAAMFK